VDKNEENKPHDYKIGGEKLCKITSRAADHVARLLKNQNRSFGALRIAVVGGGMSGLKYKMETIEGPGAKDILINSKNVRLVLDAKSALFASGSEVDLNPETREFQVTRQ
jgi:iron-sulfur cluster assembly protein